MFEEVGNKVTTIILLWHLAADFVLKITLSYSRSSPGHDVSHSRIKLIESNEIGVGRLLRMRITGDMMSWMCVLLGT